MSSPEIQPRVRQQGAEIDSPDELVTGVDQKVDAFGARLEAGFATTARRTAALDAKLDAILQRLGGAA
jgi:hypothetical protein